MQNTAAAASATQAVVPSLSARPPWGQVWRSLVSLIWLTHLLDLQVGPTNHRRSSTVASWSCDSIDGCSHPSRSVPVRGGLVTSCLAVPTDPPAPPTGVTNLPPRPQHHVPGYSTGTRQPSVSQLPWSVSVRGGSVDAEVGKGTPRASSTAQQRHAATDASAGTLLLHPCLPECPCYFVILAHSALPSSPPPLLGI